MPASPVVPLWGDESYGTTWTANVTRTLDAYRRVFSVVGAMVSVLFAGIKFGAQLYEIYDWLHAIVVVW